VVKAEGTKPMSESMIGRVFSQKMIPLRSEAVNQVKQWILASPPQGVIHANIAMATRVDSTSTLATINVPTLIISGTEDPITGEAIMKPMIEGIKGNKYPFNMHSPDFSRK
jgi:pimeloyl-ACP methyl ester carboxylesterase